MGSRRWCITDNTIAEDFDASEWKDRFPITTYFATWQKEKAASGKVHIQGYLKFEKPIRLAGLKKALGNVHAEIAKGTCAQCIAYCSKEDTRLAGPYTYGQNKEERQRTDLKRTYEKLLDGSTLREILSDQPEPFFKYSRGIQLAHSLIQEDRFLEFRKLTVKVYWGPTGSGKTSRVYRDAGMNRPYKQDCMNGQIWWDGYKGQTSLLLDDFYGQIRCSDMLKYLDGYECRLAVKGSFVYAGWTTVYITSNKHPDSWYPDVPPEVKAALLRRITEIIHVTGPAGGDMASAAPSLAPAAPEGRGYNPLNDDNY